MVTGHGVVPTPAFMPVGTAGAVKAIHLQALYDDARAQIMLSNTYHLYLRPGTAVIEAAGGLHRFSGWNGPILTDSGGYQVYSLSGTRKVTPDGVIFNSHIDGSKHVFTPEKVIEIQRSIGADIIMAFDECTPFPCEFDYARKSMLLTHQWLDRSLAHFRNTGALYGHPQAIFPIVQGSTFSELRTASAKMVAEKEAEGNAIGGLSVGEPEAVMYEMTALVCSILPADKPRYLMGVGTPANLLESIALGIDLFDCVLPTRNARHGLLYTSNGILNIKNEKWKDDFSPLDAEGTSFVDQAYSKAFLRHLLVSGETLAGMIATHHNLAFYLRLVAEARENILNGTFASWKRSLLPGLTNRL
jgi:queuine tRNA-ribosyltransferase